MASADRQTEKAYWVVVADEGSAIFYSRASRYGDLRERFTLENAAGRSKAGDLISDRGGRSFDSFGRGRHTMAKEKSGPKTHVAERFAKQIATKISAALQDGGCLGYTLVAPPRFLGFLRQAVTTHCSLQPDKTIDKELVGRSAEDLRSHVDSER